MSALALKLREHRVRLGLKGPRAADLLLGFGIVVPTAPNTWTHSEDIFAADGLLAARLGTTEFFLEEGTAGTTLKGISASLDERAPGGRNPCIDGALQGVQDGLSGATLNRTAFAPERSGGSTESGRTPAFFIDQGVP